MTRREILLVVLLALIVSWFVARKHDKALDKRVSSVILPKNDIEKIIVNPEKHTIVVVKPNEPDETLFLPDRPSSIEVTKQGTVVTTVKQYGTELSPFVGGVMGDRVRVSLGVDLAYYHRLDLGIAFLPTVSGVMSLRVGASVGYNLYSNTSLIVGLDNHLSPFGGIVLKF